jgi:hypothetical protein
LMIPLPPLSLCHTSSLRPVASLLLHKPLHPPPSIRCPHSDYQQFRSHSCINLFFCNHESLVETCLATTCDVASHLH